MVRTLPNYLFKLHTVCCTKKFYQICSTSPRKNKKDKKLTISRAYDIILQTQETKIREIRV